MESSMSRCWCFTVNNPKPNYEDLYSVDKWQYMVVGREQGEKGTYHLQGFVIYKSRTRFSTVKKQMPKAHIERMRGTSAEAADYCKKEGAFEEYGDFELIHPTGGKCGGLKKAERYKNLIRLSKKHEFDKIEEEYPINYWSNYHTMKRIAMDNPIVATTLDKLTNEWIWGKTGVGKSSAARLENPGAYIKSHNKWWCGYQGEKVAIIDDLSKTDAQWMGEHLKQWADHYPFPAEVKYTQNILRPEKIVVTSNYSIEDLFGHDEDLVAALKRRFKVRHIIDPFPHLMKYAEHSQHSEEEKLCNYAQVIEIADDFDDAQKETLSQARRALDLEDSDSF